MRHYQQEDGECLLAAVCMVYDRNYTRESHLFEVTYGKTWTDAILKQHTHWQAFEFLAILTGEYAGSVFVSRTDRWKTPGHITRPPLGGRGILSIDSIDKDRHAVAWCDGEIYDSCAEGPLPWNLWITFYPGAWLDGYHPYRTK